MRLELVFYGRAATHAARPMRDLHAGQRLPVLRETVRRERAELEVHAGARLVSGHAVVIVVEIGIAPGERRVRPPAPASAPPAFIAVAEPQFRAARFLADVGHRLAVERAAAKAHARRHAEVVAGEALRRADHAFGHVVRGKSLEPTSEEKLVARARAFVLEADPVG